MGKIGQYRLERIGEKKTTKKQTKKPTQNLKPKKQECQGVQLPWEKRKHYFLSGLS